MANPTGVKLPRSSNEAKNILREMVFTPSISKTLIFDMIETLDNMAYNEGYSEGYVDGYHAKKDDYKRRVIKSKSLK